MMDRFAWKALDDDVDVAFVDSHVDGPFSGPLNCSMWLEVIWLC
jgi:hypothetical protein